MLPVQTDSFLLTSQPALERTVARCDGCISADLSGSVAILHPISGLYFGLNEVGASVWNFLTAPRKVGEVLDHLLEEYEVEEEVCCSHLTDLLKILEEHQLITVSD